jgi:hypothetical protein
MNRPISAAVDVLHALALGVTVNISDLLPRTLEELHGADCICVNGEAGLSPIGRDRP